MIAGFSVLIALSLIIHLTPSWQYPIPVEYHAFVEKRHPPSIMYCADASTVPHIVTISAATDGELLALVDATVDTSDYTDRSRQDRTITLRTQARNKIRDLRIVDDVSAPAPPPRLKPGSVAWYSMGIIAIISIVLTGILSGLCLGVMSVDMTKLRVWMRTGSKKRRAQAIKIMAVRKHPNWLLCTFILSGTMVAEGLPLALGQIFSAGALMPFLIATILVVVFGQLIPQAIVPMYVLDIASRATWFVHLMMWITAPLSVPLGWIFRWIKVLGKRKYGFRADGILDREELEEYLRLHAVGVGLGGTVDDKVGRILQMLVREEGGFVGKGESMEIIPRVDEAMLVDAKLLEIASTTRSPWFIVSEGGEGSGVVAGTVLTEVIRASGALPVPVFVRDLPIHAVPLVREGCRITVLADWLMGSEEKVAIVVPATERIASGVDGISWSPGGQKGQSPSDQHHITRHPITPLGIIDSHYFLRRLFLGEPSGPSNNLGHSWSETSDRDVQRGDVRPNISSILTPLKAKVLPSGLRKRSNPHGFASVWLAPLEDDNARGFRPVRQNPLANQSSSHAVHSDFESDTSEASTTGPDTSTAKVTTIVHTKHTISPVGEESADETAMAAQVTDKASKETYADQSHSLREVSANAQSHHKYPSEHGSDSGQHGSAKSIRSMKRYGQAVRFGRRDEAFTDPADDEVARAIMVQGIVQGLSAHSSENDPAMMRA